MTLHPDTELFTQLEGLLVGETELSGELVDPDFAWQVFFLPLLVPPTTGG